MDGVFQHGTPGLCNELKHTTYWIQKMVYTSGKCEEFENMWYFGIQTHHDIKFFKKFVITTQL